MVSILEVSEGMDLAFRGTGGLILILGRLEGQTKKNLASFAHRPLYNKKNYFLI